MQIIYKASLSWFWPVFKPEFFRMFLADTYMCPILGPLAPLFCISGDISSGFQSQSGLCLNCFCRGGCHVHSLRSTSGAPTYLLMASMLAGHFPHVWESARDGPITCTKDECTIIVPATWQTRKY